MHLSSVLLSCAAYVLSRALPAHGKVHRSDSFTGLHPYYEEVMPSEMYTVKNSTLQPSRSTTGLALQVMTGSTMVQVHTHVNVKFPEYVNRGQCFCQIAFRMTADVEVSATSSSAELDVFELDSPTTTEHHPNINGYQGRVDAKELVKGSAVGYVEYGLQPFECSSMHLGGKEVGYEIAPKWWDDSVVVNVKWSGKMIAFKCLNVLL